ncbi:MAG: lantibiotic biosynthesis protein [Micromonosporaceae bacterium]
MWDSRPARADRITHPARTTAADPAPGGAAPPPHAVTRGPQRAALYRRAPAIPVRRTRGSSPGTAAGQPYPRSTARPEKSQLTAGATNSGTLQAFSASQRSRRPSPTGSDDGMSPNGALAAWQARRAMPVQVRLHVEDQRLLLDLDQRAHRAVLRRHLHRAGCATLTEVVDPQGAGWCAGRPHAEDFRPCDVVRAQSGQRGRSPVAVAVCTHLIARKGSVCSGLVPMLFGRRCGCRPRRASRRGW